MWLVRCETRGCVCSNDVFLSLVRPETGIDAISMMDFTEEPAFKGGTGRVVVSTIHRVFVCTRAKISSCDGCACVHTRRHTRHGGHAPAKPNCSRPFSLCCHSTSRVHTGVCSWQSLGTHVGIFAPHMREGAPIRARSKLSVLLGADLLIGFCRFPGLGPSFF